MVVSGEVGGGASRRKRVWRRKGICSDQMAWFGNVSLGNFPDLAGAVNKLSESVKNIEKNFDNALGLEDKSPPGEASGIWPLASDRKTLFEPVMSFMGQRGDGSTAGELGKEESSEHPLSPEEHNRISADESSASMPIASVPVDAESEDIVIKEKDDIVVHNKDGGVPHLTDITPPIPEEFNEVKDEAVTESIVVQANADSSIPSNMTVVESVLPFQQEGSELETSDEMQSDKSKTTSSDGGTQTENINLGAPVESHQENDSQVSHQKPEIEPEQVSDEVSPVHLDVLGSVNSSLETDSSDATAIDTIHSERPTEDSDEHSQESPISLKDSSRDFDLAPHDIGVPSESVEMGSHEKDFEANSKEKSIGTSISFSDYVDPRFEVEKVKKEMKSMEAALQGAARQAQSKADEIARLMNENEQLKLSMEHLKRNSRDAEIDALRDEYHQRVGALERKIYALTRERDTLRREQNKKSDTAILLKEKDEIISQVMAEGEELSKKQAAQESTIRKLRAQIREFEEEKQRLNSKLQVEEAKVDSIKKDKTDTEKLLQETIERNQADLSAQKEFYTTALNAAKEAEALAEARVNSEARIELESRLKEAGERESMLVQALEELRQTLSRTEQQAVVKEDMLRRDIDDLQNRYQASELRYNELVTQVPESTRPLLRQIEAMQETSARRAEAWAGVERALNSRLQEAEAKAAAAEEKERAMNERLSQNLSRITVLETQVACLRTEQTQLSRSLEKERQRASESRQEYLAALEEAATQEGRAKQLEDEIKDLRSKHKRELLEEIGKMELLEKELERERTARSELEKIVSRHTSVLANQEYTTKSNKRGFENGNAPIRKLSSLGSMGSMEESLLLQASLDSSHNFLERRASGETTMSPYFLKSMTPSAFEAALRQKDGELASYVSRLSSLESIRDSLSEELVKFTEQCEKLRAEAAVLPGIRAELEALRRRHSSALELMGERDEALEELRADIADLKEMYREQVDLLVNKIQVLSSSAAA